MIHKAFTGARRLTGALLLGAGIAASAVAADAAVTGSGRYPAAMSEDPGLTNHTVYAPQALKPFGRGNRLPVVLWGNGGCGNAGNSSRALLTELASHGYLVIANGPVKELPAPRGAAPTAAPAPAPSAASASASEGGPARVGPPPGAAGTENLSKTSQLFEALEWATKESARKDSPLYGRIDTTKVAAMGTSCGGLQAIEIAGDPRVKTVIAWSSGTLDYARAGANVTRADLQKLHGPILYVTGGSNDIASPFALQDFNVIEKVPVVLATNEGAGHGGPLGKENGGDWAPLGVAWLDWQLKGQRAAARMFTGAKCSLCSDPAWKLQKKHLD
jgi:dienelactone hydrolase